MATYQVEMLAKVVTDYTVEANSKEEAIKKAKDELGMEFTTYGEVQAEAYKIVDGMLEEED